MHALGPQPSLAPTPPHHTARIEPPSTLNPFISLDSAMLSGGGATSGARSMHAAMPLISPSSGGSSGQKRRAPTGSFPTHAAGAHSSQWGWQSHHVVWLLACVWAMWLLCMLLLGAHPGLPDPLGAASRARGGGGGTGARARRTQPPARAARMVERPHGAHHHQPAMTALTQAQLASLQRQREAQQAAAAAAAAPSTQAKQRSAVIIPVRISF